MASLRFVVILVCVAMFGKTGGISCKSCSVSYYKGEPSRHVSCFDSALENGHSTCYSTSQYCRTQVRTSNGVLYYVDRQCTYPYNDHDTTTYAMPGATQCKVSGSTTDCYYSCNKTICNIQPTRLMKQCSSNCSYDKSQGKCDYITGKCVCNPGVHGADCSISTTAGTRTCVQCNEEMNPNCAKGAAELPAATSCPDNMRYCVVTKSSLLNTNGEVARSLISRSCSSSYDRSGCSFASPPDSALQSIYTAYTCLETCIKNKCNTGIPSETSPTILQCVQCTATTGSSCDRTTTTSLCPPESKYCYSTVEYYESQSEYWKFSVKRGCSFEKIKSTECVTTTVPGLKEVKKVSCHESCTTSGCNTGWPARPKCVRCSATYTSITSATSLSCLNSKSSHATSCYDPTYTHCYERIQTVSNGNNVTVMIQRDCALDSVTKSCEERTIEGVTIKDCHMTCDTTGCNAGSRMNADMYPILFTILVASKLFTFM